MHNCLFSLFSSGSASREKKKEERRKKKGRTTATTTSSETVQLVMDSYTEMDHEVKREEDHSGMEEARLESPSRATLYRDFPSAQDVATPRPSRAGGVEGARMRIKPRNYNGETTWRDYRSHFDKVCVINGWAVDKLQYLWVHLEGTALSFVEGLPVTATTSYEVLCDALGARFGADRFAAVFKAELQQRKQRNGESLSALGQEMRRLVQRAYPSFTEVAMEEIAVEKFIDALEDSAMRLSIHQTHPTGLEQAVEHAMQLEAWNQAEKKKKVTGKEHVRSVPEENEIAETLKVLAEEIRLLKEERKGKGNQQGQTRLCYACGKPGHFAKDCYSKKAKATGNAPQLH